MSNTLLKTSLRCVFIFFSSTKFNKSWYKLSEIILGDAILIQYMALYELYAIYAICNYGLSNMHATGRFYAVFHISIMELSYHYIIKFENKISFKALTLLKSTFS